MIPSNILNFLYSSLNSRVNTIYASISTFQFDYLNVEGKRFSRQKSRTRREKRDGLRVLLNNNIVAAVSSSLLKTFSSFYVMASLLFPFPSMVRRFLVLERVLYRRTKTVPLRVLSLSELNQVLTNFHDQRGHFAFDNVWLWVRQRYRRPYLYAEVRHFVASCSSSL